MILGDDLYLDEDDWDEDEAFEQREDDLAECTCGAYIYSAKAGRHIHVADCICGNT